MERKNKKGKKRKKETNMQHIVHTNMYMIVHTLGGREGEGENVGGREGV